MIDLNRLANQTTRQCYHSMVPSHPSIPRKTQPRPLGLVALWVVFTFLTGAWTPKICGQAAQFGGPQSLTPVQTQAAYSSFSDAELNNSTPPIVPALAPESALPWKTEDWTRDAQYSGSVSADVAKAETDLLKQNLRVGYDEGFILAGRDISDLGGEDLPFRLKFNGWGQLRMTNFISEGTSRDFNQFQLKRARLVFSGHAFTSDFSYFIALDGRSASNDTIRLLDYYLSYDLGHHDFGWQKRVFVVKAGQYKIPFTLARAISGQEFQFADRSVASMYFDANRSLAVGLYGERKPWGQLLTWETAVFNGLITGGAETGSAGTLDNNFAISGRLSFYPHGDWGKDDLCDWDFHEQVATRTGIAFAMSSINREGTTEFGEIRVVDSGNRLADILPGSVSQYHVATYSVDYSLKFRGWSVNSEYYFRNLSAFQGDSLPDLFDHGFWLQSGYFLVPRKLEALARWSRVVGKSGSLGSRDESSDERAAGLTCYFRRHAAKLTLDATYLDGAPINSFALDISPGAVGWLWRTQLQFSF